jgi:hypothetical protein
VELLRLLKARGNGLFENASAEFLGEKGKSFFKSIEETGRRLSSEGGSQETRRKFLLRQLPETTKNVPSRLTDEGWLPGKPSQEILRRERSGRKVSHYRVIHDGLPEQVTRPYFAKLWPLTEKKRIRKQCYELKAGRTEWVFSDFQDRDLVLAECKQPPGEAELELPDWITEVLIKEVTGIKKYEDARIAASRQRDSSAGS